MVNPADQLRQESGQAAKRASLLLPPVQAALPTRMVGAQYEFGLRDIAGEK